MRTANTACEEQAQVFAAFAPHGGFARQVARGFVSLRHVLRIALLDRSGLYAHSRSATSSESVGGMGGVTGRSRLSPRQRIRPSVEDTAVLPKVNTPPAPHPPSHSDTPPSQHTPQPAERGTIWDVVRRAQEGDAEAFGEIYDCYAETVYKYIFFRVGTKALAEDLTSETFLRALRRIGSVSWQGRDLGAWLVTIARNLIADHFKSGRFRLEVATADMLDQDQEAQGIGGRPEAEVLDKLTNATLLDAIKKLNPEQQECIVLRFLEGLSVSETAHVMDKNDGAIKALQYRAVRSLGRLLPEGFMP